MSKRHRKETPTPAQILEAFVKGCGLRPVELEQLRVRDIYEETKMGVYETRWVHVEASEESPEREVPFLELYRWAIDAAIKGRAPDDPVFPELPDLDYDQLREEYADLLFFGTLDSLGVVRYPTTFHEMGQRVKRALGLKRLDKTLQSWLRQAKRDFLHEVPELYR